MSLKIYNYISIFLISASIMIIEIVGAKIMSPVFGSSHTVWMSQITVTLVSLAIGAYLSTFLKTGRTYVPYLIIFFSAIYSILTTLNFNEIAYSFLDLSLVSATYLASSILFIPPLILMGMVYPYLVNEMKELDPNIIGKMSALSTLGCVSGSVGVGFAVEYYSNSFMLLANGMLLSCISFIFFSFYKKTKLNIFLIIIPIALILVFLSSQKQYKGSNEIVLETVNSNFGEIVVTKKGNEIYFYNNNLIQGAFNEETKRPDLFVLYLIEYLSLNYKEKIENALHLGFGVGSVPLAFTQKGIENTVVEINPAMVHLAEKYLPNPKNKVFIDDSRHFLKTNKEKFDIVILDSFIVDSVPAYLLTEESFREIKGAMKIDGNLVMNSFGQINPDSIMTQSIFMTMSQVFKNVKVFYNENNILFLASDFPLVDYKIQIDLPDKFFDDFLGSLNDVKIDTSLGFIMKDNFNPIEIKDNSPREFYRKRMLSIREIEKNNLSESN